MQAEKFIERQIEKYRSKDKTECVRISDVQLDGLDSSVEFIAKGKGNPERERREKPVVRSTPPVVDSIVTPAVQTVEVHVDRLVKYEAAYRLKKESRRRRR